MTAVSRSPAPRQFPLRPYSYGELVPTSAHHFGTFCQPGKGPGSSFQPVEDFASGTARRFVQDFRVKRNSSYGLLCGGVFVTSGTGQRRMVLSAPADATHFPSGENATATTPPSWPKKRWGSAPETGPIRTMPSPPPLARTVSVGSRAAAQVWGWEAMLVGMLPDRK